MDNLRTGLGQSEMVNRRSMKQCTNSAIEFFKELKGRLIKDKFDEFVKVFKDYKAKRIEILDFIKNMKEILQGHRDLILRFNTFMPIGYEIELPLEDEQSQPKKHVKLEDATRFLNKIKAQFQGDDDYIYKSFMKILVMYYKKNKSFNMVCQEVTTLLKGHPNLLDEFYDFLPKPISANYRDARNSVRGDV